MSFILAAKLHHSDLMMWVTTGSTALCTAATLKDWFGLTYVRDGLYWTRDNSLEYVVANKVPATPTSPAYQFHVRTLFIGIVEHSRRV